MKALDQNLHLVLFRCRYFEKLNWRFREYFLVVAGKLSSLRVDNCVGNCGQLDLVVF